MKIYTKIVMVWAGDRYVAIEEESFDYTGSAALCCGATSEQKDLEHKQAAYYDVMTAQAQQVFGFASNVFTDLQSAFAPILAAGPNQHGYNAEALSALNSQATEGTAQTYHKASEALGEGLAARGGGNAYIPSGAEDQLRAEVAASAAQNESAQKLNIVGSDYALGRANWQQAANSLAGATGTFNPAAGMSNAATGAGSAASTTANEIAMADNSWVNATIGAIGGVVGAGVTGGMSNLGKGAGFFGGNAPCWIAEAIYGPGFETDTLRFWLNNVWAKRSTVGKLVVTLYSLVGRGVAQWVRSSRLGRAMFKPLFDRGLKQAMKELKVQR